MRFWPKRQHIVRGYFVRCSLTLTDSREVTASPR